MARKKEIYHIDPLREGKKKVISALIDECDIKTTEDIQTDIYFINASSKNFLSL